MRQDGFSLAAGARRWDDDVIMTTQALGPERGIDIDQNLPAGHPLRDGRTTSAPLLSAYRGRPTQTHPVWFMRQAGRSLPEYRAARVGNGMLESCLTPDLAAEITLQPVRRHHVDAAILFSDIVVPLKLAGIGVEIVAGVGPVVEFRSVPQRMSQHCPSWIRQPSPPSSRRSATAWNSWAPHR